MHSTVSKITLAADPLMHRILRLLHPHTLLNVNDLQPAAGRQSCPHSSGISMSHSCTSPAQEHGHDIPTKGCRYGSMC
ncbi:hypothetical protein PBY51_015462 [Eleginops maclovinus]|uniref:Uncharacterized protein n=1 Tax=Eleginops maclovinus TaxID=56733 RepID=A0AAN7X6T4_ELEMC|nr:hypothetical protein PBY51_015462 [Eleginops maclovinus]